MSIVVNGKIVNGVAVKGQVIKGVADNGGVVTRFEETVLSSVRLDPA